MMITYEEHCAPMELLIIEDNPADVRLTQEAFGETDVSVNIHVAHDGVDALAFLRREGTHTDAPRPDIILLDLNLPKMDGRDVLAHIKSNERLRNIPTVILTNSEAEADIVKTYELQATCYLTKPVQTASVRDIVKCVDGRPAAIPGQPLKRTM